MELPLYPPAASGVSRLELGVHHSSGAVILVLSLHIPIIREYVRLLVWKFRPKDCLVHQENRWHRCPRANATLIQDISSILRLEAV